MIRISSLEKHYGALQALENINLEIKPGCITAVLGPNGAGKTTLIKSILGLVKPGKGSIEVNGTRVNGDSDYRRHIGYMPQLARYPENLSVTEIIEMICDIRNHAGEDHELDRELWHSFGLDSEAGKLFRNLSGGNRQKVSAVLAFLFRPKVLFLDEPTAGLDPVSSSILKDKIMAERDRGTTVILTSHIMSEVQELAGHVVYLLEGRLHFEMSVDRLMEETGQTTLERAVARKLTAAGPVQKSGQDSQNDNISRSGSSSVTGNHWAGDAI
jgi:Cu-processing system ATP-binding protein